MTGLKTGGNMKSGSKFGGVFTAKIEMSEKARAGAKYGGVFIAKCERDGEIIWEEKAHNIVTNEGLDASLDIMFHAATQLTTWYLLLYEDDVAGGAALTYAVPTFTECTAYDEATRQEYVEAAASSQSITNSANDADFTISATKTLYGAAIVAGGTDADTKDDQAGGGTMYASGKFSSSRSVVDGDIVHLTYTLSAADDA